MNKWLKKSLAVSVITLLATTVQAANLEVSFIDSAWNGKKLPKGQACNKDGGNGSTPAMKVSNIPAGTTAILVEFNDKSYKAFSTGGGHGIVGFKHQGGSEAELIAVLGGTKEFPEGTWLVQKNKGWGAWESEGYLPPCSGGQKHVYAATLHAIDINGKRLAEGNIQLAKY